MKILRLISIRILLCAGLIAALAMPPKIAAETITKTTAHKTTSKKVVKKTVKKAVKKGTKKDTKKIIKPVARPIATTGKYVSAAKDGINVLANPAPDAELRWEIFDRFPLLIKKRQGAWLQVTDFEGDTGWIQDSLITAEKSVIVCKQKIHLRQDPNDDKNNPIIANVKYGVIFTPLEKKGDWLKVRHADKTEGWLNKDLVWPSDPLD
jgi:SH3-like domain-containing protein